MWRRSCRERVLLERFESKYYFKSAFWIAVNDPVLRLVSLAKYMVVAFLLTCVAGSKWNVASIFQQAS